MKANMMITKMMLALMVAMPATLAAQNIIESRDTGPFKGVEAISVFRVSVTQDEGYFLEIEAPEEHLEFIETTVKDGILFIDYSRSVRNLRDLEVRITAPEFTYLHAGGAASIKSTNTLAASSMQLKASGAGSIEVSVIADHLISSVSGAGNMRLAGEAQLHELSASGVSNVRAYDLETATTDVKSSGTSSVRITVREALTAQASGTSGIIVRGNPPVADFTTSGTASVRGVRVAPAPVTGKEAGAEIKKNNDDTLIVSVGQREVIIIDGRTPRVTTRKTVRKKWRNEWSGFYLGVNGYMTPDRSLELNPGDRYLDLEYNNSIQVNLNLWQQSLVLASGSNSALGIFSGIGFSWNNYRFSENIRLVHEQDSLGYFYDDNYNFRKNKLTVSHLNVPLMLEFQTRQQYGNRTPFHMSAGINVGLRLRSHTKQVYQDNGSRQKDKDFKSFHLAPFRYEAVARIGWGRVNLFATYALNEMFRQDKGPELHPFSVGIRLINF